MSHNSHGVPRAMQDVEKSASATRGRGSSLRSGGIVQKEVRDGGGPALQGAHGEAVHGSERV